MGTSASGMTTPASTTTSSRCPTEPAGHWRCFSLQAIVPLFAAIAIPVTVSDAVDTMKRCMDDLAAAYEHTNRDVRIRMTGDGSHFMVGVVDADRLSAILLQSSIRNSFCPQRYSVAVEVPP